MPKKKIALLGVKYYPSRGGVSRVVEDTVIQLKDDFEFTIYCYEHPEAADNIPGVKVVQIPAKPGGVAGVFWYYYLCTQHALKHGDYDLVHVHKTDAAFFIPMLTKQFTVIATSHEAPYKRDKWSWFTKQYFHWMEKRFIGSKAKLTSISRPLSDYYEEKYDRVVDYIPNGVDIQMNPNFDLADERLAKHGINGPFVFFAARRVMGTKGAHHMLKGLKQIGYQGHVVIAGDTTQLPQYTRQLQEMAKGMNVHFIGYVDNKSMLMALVQRAEVFVFPSETEGMSIMLLEVTNMGTPIIASDIPENTAVFDDHELLFFRNQDADDFAAKFQWAQQHPKEMQQMAANARRRVQTEYNRELIAQQYKELYESMAGEKVIR